jgi:AraC-like DNA-binding protein/predicted negative regulator of RcsB-dependent stress response
LKGASFRQSTDSLFFVLDRFNDRAVKIDITEKLYRLAMHKDIIAHIRALTYKVIYSDTANPGYFQEAFALAESSGLKKEMDYVEDRWSRFYMDRKQYDSAMNHILRMRDMEYPARSDEMHRNIIHLLGDVYYNANLFTLAQKEYMNLYRQYPDQGSWNFWRPYVVMNNLGQIELIRGNYVKALDWFKKTVKIATENLLTSDKNNILAYSHCKIAETFLKIGDLDSASAHLTKAESFPLSEMYEDVIQERIFLKSNLLHAEGRWDEALATALHLEPGDTPKYNRYRFFPGIYLLLSEIYRSLKFSDLSLDYLRKYSKAVDSLDKQGTMAMSMVILTERNHQITQTNLKITAQWNRLLWIGFILLALVLTIMSVMHSKLFRSKLILVRKTMELQAMQPSEGPGVQQDQKKGPDAQENFSLLMNRVNELLEGQKLYLDPHLNIQQVAAMLSTNRTYLSKAINTRANTTFPNFINEYRIRESVGLITGGFTLNHTIEALAQQCGFSNRTVFISVFKKHTGVTPSFFISNYQSQNNTLEEDKPGLIQS